MSAAVIAILAKERSVVRSFREAGATGVASAKSLEDLHLRAGLGFRRLRERAVVRAAAPDRYYLDEEVWAAVRRGRTRLSVVLFVIMLLILAGGLALLSPTLQYLPEPR
jgi:hypothetical protein